MRTFHSLLDARKITLLRVLCSLTTASGNGTNGGYNLVGPGHVLDSSLLL